MINSNKKYWKNIASEYDKNVGEKGDVRHEQIINPIVFNFLGNLTDKIVLDAGCGNGYLSRVMAKNATRVIGIDFTDELIKKARQQDNPNNIEFIMGDLEQLKFSDSFFDTILCNMVLMDVEHVEKAIKELSRVLKISGILVASLIHPCFENPPYTYSIFDENGRRTGRMVQKYFETGLVTDNNQKVVEGQPYQHYHYMVSDYFNAFSKSGLCLQKVSEPNGNEILSGKGGMNDHAPTFIVMKYKKLK